MPVTDLEASCCSSCSTRRRILTDSPPAPPSSDLRRNRNDLVDSSNPLRVRPVGASLKKETLHQFNGGWGGGGGGGGGWWTPSHQAL